MTVHNIHAVAVDCPPYHEPQRCGCKGSLAPFAAFVAGLFCSAVCDHTVPHMRDLHDNLAPPCCAGEQPYDRMSNRYLCWVRCC